MFSNSQSRLFSFIAHNGKFGSFSTFNLAQTPALHASSMPCSDNKLLDPSGINGNAAVNLTSHRTYIRKRNRLVKIPPTKPLHFDYSGDIEKELKALDLSAPIPWHESVKNLAKDNEAVQKIFSLDFADGKTKLAKHLEIITKETKEHDADIKSLELNIARRTILIRNLMPHCLQFRHDKKSKMTLIKMIWNRHKLLRKLRRRDYEKFTWLAEKMQLQYRPEKRMHEVKRVTKRAARKAVARNAFLDVKKQKLAEFRDKLASEREAFEKHKEAELSQIEALLKGLGINEMNSTHQVLEDLDLGEPYLIKKEKPKTRRQKIMEMKFELYKNLPKYQQKW